ncbi:methionyl-tRNA formyltransferase [Thalassotalea agarivorans]|uniref:Methionyl-tRNA formyltransferase n=1 Tax=Thalassotalea agarivorans TaxID=349064 RepID=A0A1I0GD96_THASX|nr:methionyl-tRNA formyltransferase [Thalassotalea agarivorans]SET68993.1 methionyl-tRNA formyltransferase [Thalassotalea agarivorans]
MTKPLRIVFAGTPDFAAQHLAALIDSHHDVVAVYCPPDKPAGRGKKLTACATKQLALSHDLTVEQPANFKAAEDVAHLASYNADVMVVVAYGLLLPKSVLETPKLGCVNVHGSILPKWRGAAPIQRSLEAGDSETGVTIMQMDEGLDTGDMILTATCPITLQDTSNDLYQKLAELGPKALVEALDKMASGDYPRIPQDNALANYAHKLTKEEAELNFDQPADVLDRKIRALQPWPICQFNKLVGDKAHKIRVWKAQAIAQTATAAAGTIVSVTKAGIDVATSEGVLRLEQLQLPGKKPLSAADIINGRADWFQVGQDITQG